VAKVEVQGSLMRVDTTQRMLALGAPLFVLIGAAMVFFAARSGVGEQVFVIGVPGALAVGTGVVFSLLRRGLVLDRDAQRVTAWWCWLFLRGDVGIDVAGQAFTVEKTSTHSRDQGTTYFYRILLGEQLLHTISEHQGDKEGAEQLAQQMAKHLGVSFAGHRDCPDMKRRDALRAKYALAPLIAIAVVMALAACSLLLLGGA
jgi:hypothetical protein